jgi:hypothetical protein
MAEIVEFEGYKTLLGQVLLTGQISHFGRGALQILRPNSIMERCNGILLRSGMSSSRLVRISS